MKKLVFTFGRMNPPTIGHEKLANKIKEVARKENANPRIYLSHTQNPKKDPLSYNDKYRFATKAFGIVKRSQSKQIFQILPEIEKEGFTDIIMVVGSDRISEFDRVLQKYNGKDYNFNSIKTVSSGDRDPDAQGVEGMSGSKLRGVAMSGDEKTFKSGLASKLSDADKTKIYNLVRKNLKEAIMNEWTEEDDLILDEALDEVEFTEEELNMLVDLGELYEVNEVLNFMQRIKKARIMKRLGPKLARLRKIASKKMKGAKKLVQLARKAAIKILRKKLVGKDKAANYKNLSPADKKQVDLKVQKHSSRIGALSRKILPQVRKDTMARVKAARTTQKNEYVPESHELGEAIPKSTMYALVKDGKVIAKGSKSDMMSKKKKEGGTVFNAPSKKVGDAMKEAMVPVGKMTGKGFEPAKKDKDTKLPPHLKDLKTIRKAFAKSKKVKEDLDEAKSSTGYKLYHKSFSDAMQHAYAHAKSKFGITIKKDEIDNKVATGPKKPGTGKTNTYRLKGDRGNIQVQVANLDGKKYELNMYKEEYHFSFDTWKEAVSPAQQAAIAISKKERGEKPKKEDKQLDITKGEKKYFKGVKRDKKDDRERAFDRGKAKHHDDPSAYPDSHPGDKGAKTKLSKHTKKYRDMFGEDVAQTSLKRKIDARNKRQDKTDAIRLARAKMRDTLRDIRGEDKDIDEISTQKINRYYDKAKQSHDRAGNSAFARHLRKEPGIEKDLDTMRRRKAGIATARSIAIKKLRGEKPGKLRDESLWDNIRKKKERIARGSGERMRSPGEKGAPTPDQMRQAKGESFDYSANMSEDATAALKKKSEKSGIPLGILRKVYNRGMAAWRTGHRPGATQQQWGFARVNSFITKGSGTWGKADKDLAAKARGAKKESIHETGGAGEEGTNKLLSRYLKDTPGQQEVYNVDDDFRGKLKKKFKDIRKKDGFDSVKEENMEEKLTKGQQSKLDDLEAYLGHLQRVSMTPSRRAEIEITKKKIKKLKSEETGDIEEMTGINVPELIKTTIHRLSHPKGYADLIKDYIKRAKQPHSGTNGAVLSDVARERGFDRVKPIQDYINRLVNKGKLPKSLMASHCREEVEIDEDGCPIDLFDHVLEEAEYQGKKVTLNDPVRSSDGNKKFHVYVKNEKGNVIKLGFGDPNMEIKRDDPARRKSFRARHNCDNPGPKYKARYWSCFQWRGGAKVDN